MIQKSKGKLIIIILIIICFIIMIGYVEQDSIKKLYAKTVGTDEVELTEEQKETLQSIKNIYNVENQQAIQERLEQAKAGGTYTEEEMLIEQNPYGTNTLSLYVYFPTETASKVSYTIHVEDENIPDFTRTVNQSETYMTEHEFQVIGLVPNQKNMITFTIEDETGAVHYEETTYKMDALIGEEETILEVEELTDAATSDGLYVVMGNDSSQLDFMYYYDDAGVIRGEIPIIGYRSHRLLFDDQGMYYSISTKKIAYVNALGQVLKVYDTGDYTLHHDYVFDDSGNILALASDDNQESIEDVVISINRETGDVMEVLDLSDILSDYKGKCVSSYSGETGQEELDWAHINTIQWMGNGQILLSCREVSTIIKIQDMYENPSIDYMIGDESFWTENNHASELLTKIGDFTIQGGQHSITYEPDESLEDGQYYLYMFNNNIGVSTTYPDFDWSEIGLKEDSAADGEYSYYYKYLVDENAKSFELVDSFQVPYSGYVSSVQNIGDNTVVDSGMQGWFGEYDENHTLIKSFTMEKESFIYRVYKYDFQGFYF